MKQKPDIFTGNLFEDKASAENKDMSETPRVISPASMQRNAKNEIVDNEGNVYDEKMNLVREALDPYFVRARTWVEEQCKRNNIANPSPSFIDTWARMQAGRWRAKDAAREAKEKK
jgi:hypothetical protein